MKILKKPYQIQNSNIRILLATKYNNGYRHIVLWMYGDDDAYFRNDYFLSRRGEVLDYSTRGSDFAKDIEDTEIPFLGNPLVLDVSELSDHSLHGIYNLLSKSNNSRVDGLVKVLEKVDFVEWDEEEDYSSSIS